MAYELPSFMVKIEGDVQGYSFNISCRDERIIAAGIPGEYRDWDYKRLSPDQFNEFLEEITAEFWKAGKKEGREEVIREMRKIDDSIRALLGKK